MIRAIKGQCFSMTPEQIGLVRKSFDALWPFRRKLAEQFYRRFFELAPDTRHLFPNDMERQQLKLMDTIAAIVGTLDQSEMFQSIISHTGRKHADFGVQTSHFVAFGEALIWGLQQQFGPAFTPEMQQAWIVLFDAIQVEMMHAAKAQFEAQPCLGCALLAVIQIAAAQSFPSRPLTLVVPFAAGGPSDVAGRIVAQGLSEKLGQQVVVENPAGAGGTLGSLRVAKAPPDGYQFVIGNSGTHAWSQTLYKKPPYNTVTDFAALGLVVEAPRAIITPKNFPANTLPEFIGYVKANQNTVKYGSAGAGSASHVSCILLNAAIGVDIVHVPYRGLGPAMQDLIAGRIDYMCDSPSTSRPQIETNNVKAIATTGAKRTSVLPDVPTAREQGLDFEVMAWQGLFLPKDTPDSIVRHLNQALSGALDLPFVRERFKAAGEDLAPVERRSPEYFAKFVAAEIDKWSGPIKASGVAVD